MSRPSPAPNHRIPSAPVSHERARVATLSRSRTSDDPELLDARRALRTELLAEHIAREVARAPKLTEAQRSRLADLLRPSVATSPERPA